MVLQCVAGAWLKVLASGDQRRITRSGSAEACYTCAIQIHDCFTLLSREDILRYFPATASHRFVFLCATQLEYTLDDFLRRQTIYNLPGTIKIKNIYVWPIGVVKRNIGTYVITSS